MVPFEMVFSYVQLEMAEVDDLRRRMLLDPQFHKTAPKHQVACMNYISRNGRHRILRLSQMVTPSRLNRVIAAKEKVHCTLLP